MPNKTRIVFLLTFLACAVMIGMGFYLQDVLGLTPCPMCILQRYAFWAIGLTALACAIHGPRRWGVKVYAWMVVVFAVLGGGTAIRHSYVQHFPPPNASCGTDLEFLINNFPLAQALPKMFSGSGECSAVQWTFLWLSIPEWALVWFIIFGVTAFLVARHKRSVFR
jgi:protein dithiol:quinone oxidoreductase